ncbi:MAG: helix-turn-helix domain-containing protein [Clostridia bacterium]|nr:helix-turn-helix domain-containing protein [Clostridia bacterium]
MALSSLVYSSVHPDFALLEHEEVRSICCLLLEHVTQEELDQLEPLHAFHVYRQGEAAAVLLSMPEEEDFLGQLEERLASLGLCAGMSGPFSLGASAHGCMRKAQIALETGKKLAPGRALYPMDEFGEKALLLAAAGALEADGYEAEDFCDQSIAQMRLIDEETGTQYARSLQAYLRYGLDLRLAAQELGVHRNTLAYRMKRVQEVFGIDLENVNTCFELLFSFWLLDHLPKPKGRKNDAAFDVQSVEAALFGYVQRRAERYEAQCQGFECRLFCVGVSGLTDEERIKLLRLLRGLERTQCASAFDEDVLLFALSRQAYEGFEKRALPLCRQKGCCVVTTQAFEASRVVYRASLCRMALRAANSMHVRMQDMASTLLFMTLERRFSLAPYLYEDVIRIMDEDAQRGSALSRSLYAYLLNFRDMKRAAQQLEMHRNTMEYHMRKIDTLIGKTAGEKQRFLMMCTYKMLALPDVRQE